MALKNPVTCHLVFGALGQDGSYLIEQLSANQDRVIAVVRNSSVIPSRYQNRQIEFVKGDILSDEFVYSLFERFKPTHIYNLASASSVAESYLNPAQSLQINLEFVRLLINTLERYRTIHGQDIYLLQASSSEMFGPDNHSLISEGTSHDPRSPYAEHKSLAHKLCANTRNTRELKIGTVILFNHESPRRPAKFVSRKITRGAYFVSRGLESELVLGNIDVTRDWGYAPDYVEAMILVAKNRHVDDFVIATGQLRSLRDLCQIAFQTTGILDYQRYIRTDSSFFRSNENSGLVGDSSKIRALLGWKPKVSFEQMIEEMVRAEAEHTFFS
jgi:GDPmannose 4,6-dehydratase